MMKEGQRQLKNKWTIIFWLNIFVLISIVFVLLYNVGIDGKLMTESDFTLERFGIILAIVVIPLSLKKFHDKYKKISENDLSDFLKKLDQLFLYRMIALDAVIIFNFIGFYAIGALNFLYMAGITLIAFSLCYPIESIIDPTEKNINDNDNLTD